jgi:Zn-dependent protease
VAPHNLRGGRQGEAIVAFAGPASNLVLAAAAAIPYRYIVATGIAVPALVESILVTFIVINVLLLVFNLIPIPPLDGSRVLGVLMNDATYAQWVRLDQYGMFVVFGLFFVFRGEFSTLLNSALDGVTKVMNAIVGA